MTWLTALTTGAGAGLAYFGGLWLTLRLALGRPRRRWLLAGSGLVRLALVALTFYALCGGGAAHALAGLAGLLLARHWVVAGTAEVAHVR